MVSAGNNGTNPNPKPKPKQQPSNCIKQPEIVKKSVTTATTTAKAEAKPVERKQVSDQPRRWKTRPSSPGNRIEPVYHSGRRNAWLALAAAALVGAAILAFLLW